jgi:spermidine/putrescine transport system substrate-binding protein
VALFAEQRRGELDHPATGGSWQDHVGAPRSRTEIDMSAPRPTRPARRPHAPGLSRRGFLRGVGAAGVTLGGGVLLSGCGTDGTATDPPARAAPEDRSDADMTLNVSNWPLYIDSAEEDESVRPTLEAFEERTGITVDYTEDVNDNSEFFGRIRPQLSAGEDTGRDIIVVTDWMAGRLIQLGWVQQLDRANIPNVTANLRPALRTPDFDADRSYSVPWQSGLTGIAYSAAVTDEVRTVDELLTRPDLKGKVTFLSEMRDTMLMLLRSMDKDPADFTADDFAAAIDKLQQAVDSQQIRRFTGNDYTQDLANGNVAACIAWSGDVIQLQFEDENIKFVAPEEGLACGATTCWFRTWPSTRRMPSCGWTTTTTLPWRQSWPPGSTTSARSRARRRRWRRSTLSWPPTSSSSPGTTSWRRHTSSRACRRRRNAPTKASSSA